MKRITDEEITMVIISTETIKGESHGEEVARMVKNGANKQLAADLKHIRELVEKEPNPHKSKDYIFVVEEFRRSILSQLEQEGE